MSIRNFFLGTFLGIALAAQASAEEQIPAWQEPDFILEEIVVTLPLSEKASTEIVAEIVVTLSIEEQTLIREALAEQEVLELAAEREEPIRL